MEPTLISSIPPELPPPPAPASSKKKYLWFLLLIPLCCICVAALAAGVYFYGTSQPIKVGYFKLDAGIGEGDTVTAITTAGYTPVALEGLTAADISGLHVLFVLNEDNYSYSDYYMENLDAIDAAVKNGLVLVFHDRTVVKDMSADQVLPGGANISFVRDPGAEVQITSLVSSVTNGPGGILGDDTLDGGNSSVHGYAEVASLPSGAKVLLTAVESDQAVTFSYKYGSGTVIYSTIPLDYYIDDSDDNETSGTVAYNLKYIYTPNIIKYAGEQASFTRRLMAR